MEISNDGFICKICNIKYKNRSGLWKHNKNTHMETTPSKYNHNDNHNIIIDNHLDNHDDNHKESNSNKYKNKYFCSKCSKVFSSYQNRWRHEKKCESVGKNMDKIIEENLELKNIIKSQSDQITEIKTILTELMNKKAKVHPKTLQKINKQLYGNYNTINENNVTNNGTINNTFLIALGHENLTEIFSKKEKINVLKNKYNSLPFLVEYAHFNDKYPQFIRLVSFLPRQKSN